MAEAQSAASSMQICVDRLAQILREAIDLNRELHATVTTEREALRTANTISLAGCLKRERDLVDQIQRIEQRRRVVTATLAGILEIDVADEGEIRLNDLVVRLDDPSAGQLAALGEELRDVITLAREQSGIVRESCEALLSHVCGLMQKLNLGISKTKVYGRDGRVGVTQALCGGLDVKS